MYLFHTVSLESSELFHTVSLESYELFGDTICSPQISCPLYFIMNFLKSKALT